MKLIILEGADGTGKTTLFERLKKEYKDNENVHFWYLGKLERNMKSQGDPFQNWLAHIKHLMGFYELTNESVIVTDRSFIGNLVYGRLMEDQLHINEEEMYNLLLWLGGIFETIEINFLRCTEKQFKIRLEEKGEDYVKLEQMMEIQSGYIQAFCSLIERPRINGLSVQFRTINEGAEHLYNLIKKSI